MSNPLSYSERIAAECPDVKKHTKFPVGLGYLDWHVWAEKKEKTHVQTQCPTCKLWVIWKKKEAKK